MPQAISQATSPLSIAIVGAGKIGSTFAYQLAKGGHQVTAIARPTSERLAQMQRDGGVVLQSGERAPMQVSEALDENIAYDLVIVAVLAHQIDSLLGSLQRSRARCVHFMFVTFEPAKLQSAVGANRCSFGMPFIMAMMDREGRLKPTIHARQKTLHGDQRWVDLFTQAGLPSTLEPNMPLWLRCHAPLTVAFESVAVAALQRGRGASWSEATAAARGLKAGFLIVKTLESRLYPNSKAVMSVLPRPVLTSLFWVMSRNRTFRELLATGANEGRALADRIAAAGKGSRAVPQSAVEAVLAMKPKEEGAPFHIGERT